MSNDVADAAQHLRDWVEGDGQAIIGGAIKSGAKRERERLQDRLSNGALFPHLEHEDRVALDKAERAAHYGQTLVDRYRRRRRAMKALRGLLKVAVG